MAEGNLLTTVVGSYRQPDWLIDREALMAARVPRVRHRKISRDLRPEDLVCPESIERITLEASYGLMKLRLPGCPSAKGI